MRYDNLEDKIYIENIIEPTININYKNIPVNITCDREYFNNVIEFYKNKSYMTLGIKRTISNGISLENIKNLPCYDVIQSSIGVELIVLASIDDGGFYRLQYRPSNKADGNFDLQISGMQSLHKFENDLRKLYNIKLSDYYIDNGIEIKSTIPTYKIEILNEYYIDKTINHANHIDMHSSFPYGLAKAFPEFRELIEFYYNNRKINPEYKLILNSMIGAMQSLKYNKARLAQMSKIAIETNNKRLDAMVEHLRSIGRIPVLINTDGIWYIGEPTGYHDKNLGGWDEDHTDCKLRIKSKGCYEFIEKGKYTPVARGRRKLDLIKPRSDWRWGDIYQEYANLICCEKLDSNDLRVIEEYIDEERL